MNENIPQTNVSSEIETDSQKNSSPVIAIVFLVGGFLLLLVAGIIIAFFTLPGVFKEIQKEIETEQTSMMSTPEQKMAIDKNEDGLMYLGNKDYDNADKLFREAIRLDPELSQAYNNLGIVFSDGRKNNQEALTYFTKAIEINPNYAKALHNRGHLYVEIGDGDNAEVDLLKAVEIEPEWIEPRELLGHIYIFYQKYQQAYDQLKVAIELGAHKQKTKDDFELVKRELGL